MNDTTRPAHRVSFPSEYQSAATELVAQSTRVIRVFSMDLRADIYAHDDFVRAVSSMVRANRRSEAKIVVLAGVALESRTHGLIELCRQLPSLIQIRVLDELPDRFREDYVLSDRQGLVFRKAQHENQAWYAPEDRAETADRIEHFDHLWNRAKESPALRRLTI